MTPLIGVTTYVADARWASWERPASVLPSSYYELVAASPAAAPCALPPCAAPRAARPRAPRTSSPCSTASC